MPISVDNFCRNFGDPGAVEDRVDELEAAGMEAERNVFLSRVATIQAENETLGKKRKEKKFAKCDSKEKGKERVLSERNQMVAVPVPCEDFFLKLLLFWDILLFWTKYSAYLSPKTAQAQLKRIILSYSLSEFCIVPIWFS